MLELKVYCRLFKWFIADKVKTRNVKYKQEQFGIREENRLFIGFGLFFKFSKEVAILRNLGENWDYFGLKPDFRKRIQDT